ncbi:MAG: peptidylprolyl isomerase [Ruminococcus sp.]|nr:peptidylprolyl isomerase [Ruminococcus sp.]
MLPELCKEKIHFTITLEDGSKMSGELYPNLAKNTVENFVELCNAKFYDGLIFHRVVEGFMAQGGDPQGTGMGGSKETIKGEFASNGVNNTLSHKRGIVSMARSQNPDSASSQFFICYDDSCSFLDGNYAAFGEVTEGMEVVDDFLKVPRSLGSDNDISSPNSPIRIKEAVMIEDDENGNPRVQVTMEEFLED